MISMNFTYGHRLKLSRYKSRVVKFYGVKRLLSLQQDRSTVTETSVDQKMKLTATLFLAVLISCLSMLRAAPSRRDLQTIPAETKKAYSNIFSDELPLGGLGRSIYSRQQAAQPDNSNIFSEELPLVGLGRSIYGRQQAAQPDNSNIFSEELPLGGLCRSIYGRQQAAQPDNSNIFSEELPLGGLGRSIYGRQPPAQPDNSNIFSDELPLGGLGRSIYGRQQQAPPKRSVPVPWPLPRHGH
jgi:hypothetical protein